MSLNSDLYDALRASAAVMAILETDPPVSPSEARIYPDIVGQEIELPAVAFTRQTTEFNNTIHGTAPSSCQVAVELWCMAASREAADTLGDAVQQALSTSSFILDGRRSEIDVDDPDSIIWATVVSVLRNVQLS